MPRVSYLLPRMFWVFPNHAWSPHNVPVCHQSVFRGLRSLRIVLQCLQGSLLVSWYLGPPRVFPLGSQVTQGSPEVFQGDPSVQGPSKHPHPLTHTHRSCRVGAASSRSMGTISRSVLQGWGGRRGGSNDDKRHGDRWGQWDWGVGKGRGCRGQLGISRHS